MGFMDKLKGLFKKKDKGEKKAGAAKKEARSAAFKGEGKVADALRYAAGKVDAGIAAGKFDDKRADVFMAMLKEVEAAQIDDDAKLLQISQIIGGIINA